MSRPTKNFSISEFQCQGENCCGNSAPIHSMLLFVLQLIRDRWDSPIIVNSGYRCNVHNAAVSQNPASEHTKGLAADVSYPAGVSPEEFRDVANTILRKFRRGGGGLILYKTHAHIDLRHDGPYRRDYTQS